MCGVCYSLSKCKESFELGRQYLIVYEILVLENLWCVSHTTNASVAAKMVLFWLGYHSRN